MSTNVLPSFPGLTYEVVRTPMWDTTCQNNISGKEVRIANQTYPTWKWELTYSVLRSSAAYTEFQQMAGFFNALQGQWDTFLYTDPDDNSVSAQVIGTGDGATTAFQLVRALGNYVEPVLAPNTVANVYLNGTRQTTGYSISNWGSTTPGLVTFATPPASGVVVSVDMTYYWPCRMSADSLGFSLFMSQFYAVKKFAFQSVKN